MLHPWISKPLSHVYNAVATTKNLAYRYGIAEPYHFSVPIISIGNITTGGTGKTPIIAALVEWAVKNGLNPGVVSRGYKGDYNGVQKVATENLKIAAQLFGDEPAMLAFKYPDVPIYVCGDRVLAVQELLKSHQVDVIFADDAFQHRRLGRVLDIVVIDCMEPTNNYSPLPFGRARESIVGMARADIVLYNKVNLVSADQLTEIKNLLMPLSKAKTFDCEYKIQSLYDLKSRREVNIEPNMKVTLLSGIGRPESFKEVMESGLGCEVLHHTVFPDHHKYIRDEVLAALKNRSDIAAKYLVVTEKDAIKLHKFIEDIDCVVVARLNVNFKFENGSDFYSHILKRIKK